MTNNNHATYTTSLGLIRIDYFESTVFSIKFCVATDKSATGRSTDESERVNNPFTDLVASQLQEYFDGARTHFTFKFELQGTKFQQKVWRALCTIPYAERRTYKDIAIEIGSPLASRAVGMACNRNPMMIVVPCHRVVGSNGRLVGYAGGIDLKEKLLSIESDRGSIYPAPLSQIQSL